MQKYTRSSLFARTGAIETPDADLTGDLSSMEEANPSLMASLSLNDVRTAVSASLYGSKTMEISYLIAKPKIACLRANST